MCTPDGMVEVREDRECNGTCVPLMVWWRCEKIESIMAHVLTNHCLETCRVGAVSEAGAGNTHTTDGGTAGEGE